MGGCKSKASVIYAEKPQLQAYKSQFLAMGITQSKLTIFHQHYKSIDTENIDAITVPQMVEYLGFDKNEFIRKAFNVLVANKERDTLTFRDFVITIWNFCTLDDSEFGLFVFGVYDFDGNKELDHEEAVELMKDLYGGEKTGPDFDELTARILKQKKMGACGVQEHYFKQYCKKHPNFLLPATKMQGTLKKKIIGEKWWESKALEQRKEFCDFEFETVTSISNRLKKDKYDKDLEVNNLSETSSEAAERSRRDEEMRKYNAYKGIIDPVETQVIQKVDDDSDEEDADKRKRTKRNKKDVPVAMTSTKRRASLSSVGSTNSLGDSDRGSPRVGSLKKQRSMGSRQGSLKSMKSFTE